MLKPKGRFQIHHYRKGELLATYDLPNGITDQGKDALLDIMFSNDTQIATWYIGLIDSASYTAIDDSDTHASHSGWIENADYTEATRQQWTAGTSSSQSITNSSAVVFSINATVALKGVFIASLNTKSSTGAAILWSTALFSNVFNGENDDSLSITYTVSV